MQKPCTDEKPREDHEQIPHDQVFSEAALALYTQYRHALDELFLQPGYRTDGEISREITDLNERLAGAFLTEQHRDEINQRLKALRDECATRHQMRSNHVTA